MVMHASSAEIGKFINVHYINDGEILDLVGNAKTHVLDHTCLVAITPEADDNDTLVFGLDSLVDLPPAVEMRQHIQHDVYAQVYAI